MHPFKMFIPQKHPSPIFSAPEVQQDTGCEGLSLKENTSCRKAEMRKFLRPSFLPVASLGYRVYKAGMIYLTAKSHFQHRLPEFPRDD